VTNLEPFSIGPIAIQPPLVMAPLHEITDQPFRRMIRQVGGVGLTVSEMISSEALIRHARKAQAMMAGEGERPFSMQLSGSIPEHLAEAARMVEAAGADLVDLNMGCPASNVTSGGAGSALLKDIRLAETCVKAMVRAVGVPVTVKMRAGWTTARRNGPTTWTSCACSRRRGSRPWPSTRAPGPAVHRQRRLGAHRPGRGRRGGLPHHRQRRRQHPDDARRMFRETGCAGVMIGRAALTNPWIFRQILDPGLEVTERQRIELCMSFFRMLQELLEPREALHKMKKIGAWFTKASRTDRGSARTCTPAKIRSCSSRCWSG